jgi:taurine transport system substrate-binding protein
MSWAHGVMKSGVRKEDMSITDLQWHRSGAARRPIVVLALAVAVTGLIAAGCGASEDGGGEEAEGGKPGTLRIAYQVIPNGAPIVKNKRWLEKALKIKVSWQQFDSGANVNRAVAAGSVDIGLAGSSPVANGIASGLPYKVAWIYDVIADAEQLVAREGANVAGISDLRGKKVAAPFGSTTHYSLLTSLTKEGVDPKQVDVLDLEPDDIVAAWQRGDIDAAYVWNPALAKIKEDGKVLISSKQLAEQGTVTADLGIVRNEFAEKYPDVVTEWIKQETRAVKLYKQDPEAAAEAVGAEFNLSPQEALSQMQGLIFLEASEQATPKYLGETGKPGDLARQLTDTAKFLKSQKLIDREPSEDEFNEAVDPQFAAKAAGS